MFIRYLDYLSPRITFYHKGFLSHNSIFSGILSIISIVTMIFLAIYFSLELILKEEPNAHFYNSFIEDAGNFNLNTSSLFHFVTLIKGIEGTFSNEDFDFTAFNIIGTNLHYETFLGTSKAKGIETLNHWLYGYCRKENNKELNDLLTYDFFEHSACITKFYNSTEKRYYEVGDEKFVWPEIAHGTYNDKNQLYSVIVQKCDNKLLKHILGDGYQCKNDTEFNEYFNIKGQDYFIYIF